LVIAAIAWIILDGVKEGAEKEAGAALVSATDLAGYVAVTKQHPGTQAGGSAMLTVAELQWEDGQQESAVTTLKEFLAQYPKHPGRPAAQASLGSRLLRLGRTEEAASAFHAIMEDPEAQYLAPYALISLGDADWKAGKLDAAEESFKRVSSSYPDSPFAYAAQRRIGLLRSAPPTSIEPRPKPATTPMPTMEEMIQQGFDPKMLQNLPQMPPPVTPTPAPVPTPTPTPESTPQPDTQQPATPQPGQANPAEAPAAPATPGQP
jgi:predicted negative regulator of RcsB-dependent stress response